MARLTRLTKLPRGAAISEAWLGLLVDTINTLVEGGGGGNGGSGSDAASTGVAALAAMAGGGAPGRFALAKIADVRLSGTPVATPDGDAYRASDVKYHVKGIATAGARGIDLDNLTPTYGRPVKNGSRRIFPASKGMTCFFERDRDEDGMRKTKLWLIEGSEIVAVKVCGT